MTNEELLKRKILEFEREFQKSHVEYGLPVVDVVNGDVVFCKDEETLAAYKNGAHFFTKKVTTSIITMGVFLASIIICEMLDVRVVIAFSCTFGLLILGLLCWGYFHMKEAKLPPVKYGDVIVFDGPHRNS
ncbi:MAG: hypothetical protein E7005_01955 [Alphaproteobacteria bacterium]|nr:hypothetical protein [Alphaproteobacteria bacterium]